MSAEPATQCITPLLSLDRACARLLSQQHENGWWKGELETNICMDAEDLLLREFLGIRTPQVTRKIADWIRSQQRSDGGWSIYYAGPADLSATVEGYAALRLAGDPPDAQHIQLARERVLALGGLEQSRVFTRIWLALFGQWSWNDLPALPPEVIFLPSWFPLNIYSFACWARQTIVPLTIVASYRPSRPLPFNLHELHANAGRPYVRHEPLSTTAGRFQLLDRVLHRYERRPIGRCVAWLCAGQPSGSCVARRTMVDGVASSRRGSTH
jgi:squalene-hopene/tetraprenyl-beta-curcumene cyclase